MDSIAPIVGGFKRFVRILPDGSIIAEYTGRTPPYGQTDWIEVPRNQQTLQASGLGSVRWDEGVGLSKKTLITLSVGAHSFPADGKTEVAIGVRGVGDPQIDINVVINGTHQLIKQHEDLYLTSNIPGDFIVRLKDPYYYAQPAEYIIQAVDPAVFEFPVVPDPPPEGEE